MNSTEDMDSGSVFPDLPCRPLSQVSVDEKPGVWRSEGNDPQLLVSVAEVHLRPGLYRFAVDIAGVETEISEPCIYVADGNHWTEASRTNLESPLHDGVWTALVDVTEGVREFRFDPTNECGDFRLGRMWLEKLSDVDAAVTMLRAFVNRHDKTHLAAALNRLDDMVSAGDMDTVRQWLVCGADSVSGSPARLRIDYTDWVTRYDTQNGQCLAMMSDAVGQLPRRPLVSIVMPVYNTHEKWLRQCLDSVLAQAYPDWELCIADDASTEPHVSAVLSEYVGRDSRIKVVQRKKNGHISASSNSALDMATGSYVALLDHDDELAPHALFTVVKAILEQTQGRLFYSDEDKIDESGQRFDPYFKPDWNPDLFLSQNFISHLGVYETALVREVGGFRKGFEGSQDYDLALRCVSRLERNAIVHIPAVLYHWRAISGSTALALDEKDYAVNAGRIALMDHLERIGQVARVEASPGGYRVRRVLPDPTPSIDIIIPTRDRVDLLRQCIRSILETSSYDHFGITIIDNQSAGEDTLAYLQEIAKHEQVNVQLFDEPFNYSRMNNAAVARSKADLVVLMNNDIEAITPDWLEEMSAHAIRSEVGAVGAKLYYPDGTIQHAGVILGLFGVAGHVYCGEPRESVGQMGRAMLTQNYSALTAACLMLRRDVFNEVGGLNETLQVAFNDIDLCLKLCEHGYLNVWTPFAELYHHESASRGHEDTAQKKERFLGEVAYMENAWGEKLAHDAAYNPNLSLHSTCCELAFPPRMQ